jgi:hypothetical protein
MTRPTAEHDPVRLDRVTATDTEDPGLKQALQTAHRADPAPDRARQAGFEMRVLADWQALHTAGARRSARPVAPRGLAPARGWFGSGRRQGWALAGGAVLALTLGAVLWLQRHDPAFDELLHPDVLSQMAVGEM